MDTLEGMARRIAVLHEHQREGSLLGVIAGRKSWADPEHRARRLAAIVATKREKAPARFWSHVNQGESDECWPWMLSTSRTQGRYGALSFDGVSRLSHQVAFFLIHGYWAPYLRHTCDFGICCNPAHLIEGTHDDNMQDKVERGRQSRGQESPQTKLTEESVRAIRNDPRSHVKVALDYGINPSQICRIKQNKTWRHVR